MAECEEFTVELLSRGDGMQSLTRSPQFGNWHSVCEDRSVDLPSRYGLQRNDRRSIFLLVDDDLLPKVITRLECFVVWVATNDAHQLCNFVGLGWG